MKILVTGGAGFIGSHLCQALLDDSAVKQLIIVDNLNNYYDPNQKKINLALISQHPSIQVQPDRLLFLREDIRQTQAIQQYHPDLVIHLASMAGVRYSLEQPKLYADVNILGQIHLLEQIRQLSPPPKFIYASSSSVYGLNSKVPFSEQDPISLQNSSYACSKLAMEIYANFYHRLYNLDTIGLRFFTVYGPRGRPDMAPYKFLKAIWKGDQLTKFGSGETFRDYTYVDDIVKGILGAMRKIQTTELNTCETLQQKSICQVYNLGNHTPVSLNEFIATCEQVVGQQANIQQLPDQPGDVPKTWAGVTKAQADLGYQPTTSFKQGLTKTFEWMTASKI